MDPNQTHNLTREILESLWDLQDLHRELVHQVTRLAYQLDNKRNPEPEPVTEPLPAADLEASYVPA